jgi:hypothetical protein
LQRHDRVGQLREGALVPRDVLRDAEPRLVLSRLDVRPGGGADRAGVKLGEPHPFPRETVEGGGLVVGVAVTGQVGPAEVVGEEEDDVGAGRNIGGIADAAQHSTQDYAGKYSVHRLLQFL